MNPLENKKFYIDQSREVNALATSYRTKGDVGNANLLDRIATRPGTTWLVGPSASDLSAARDLTEVTRTSTEAAAQGTVPIYELYAILNRDACAGSSRGGFADSTSYLNWLNHIVDNLKTDAVFSVEADAVAHTIRNSCLSPAQITERYALLTATFTRLRGAHHVLAAYIDAGHSEWFPDPAVLVSPLRRSGIEQARGVAVNVSFFVPTAEITPWSQKLSGLLGKDKGILIDTSRNGKGLPPASIQGDGRWCNPSGRGIGLAPSTSTGKPHVDAYFYGKRIGESDGDCRGNPPAGVFMPSMALELAQNAQ